MSSRSLILLLATVLIPAVALTVVGVALVQQQNELIARRADDQGMLLARELADSLQARLDVSINAIEPGSNKRYPANSPVLNLGRIENGSWVPPFAPITSSLSDESFKEALRRFDQVEREGRPAVQLASDYRIAAERNENPDQKAFLFIQEARILGIATKEIREIAANGVSLTDEYGMPLSFYAMQLLGEADSSFQTEQWLNYESISFACDLGIAEFAADEHAVLREVSNRFNAIEGWKLSADSTWMLTRAKDMIVGIRLDSLGEFSRGFDAAPFITREGSSSAASLSPAFPFLALPEQLPTTDSPQTLWTLALALVLVVTTFASLLLFRDARREKRLADLRAGFVSSVSHEVRTPLTAIRLYTDSMLAYGPGQNNEWRQDLETISYETGRLTRMLDNVLRASRIEKGTDRYRQAAGDLGQPVEKAVSAMMPALEDAECRVAVRVDRVPATFDSDAIEQAVVNLLSNASKYAPGSNVQVECQRSENQATIKISDTGPGLPPESMGKIFEPYYRADHHVSGSKTGTGLGLSLVRHIARGHGGEANVESEPGKGSTFSIHLPLDA